MTRLRQRGYNLVEIGVIFVGAILMTSYGVAKYQEYVFSQEVQATEAIIEDIKEAIVEYAAENRAPAFHVYNPASSVTVYWSKPTGRPYLPCPDITGDGLEDRHGEALGTTLTIAISTTYSELRGDGINSCLRNKGMVPWRTLDTTPKDPWGNYFTYRVDPEFANALLGFDEQTVSDDSSTYGSHVPNKLPFHLGTLNGRPAVFNTDVRVLTNPDRPSLTIIPAEAANAWESQIYRENAPSLICADSPCHSSVVVSMTARVLRGEVAALPTVVRSGAVGRYGSNADLPVYVTLLQGNIIRGVPVVILSHGKNGYGAFYGTNDDGNLLCRRLPAGTNSDEAQNAINYGTKKKGGTCPDTAGMPQYGFVYHPPSLVLKSEGNFDDIVSWMSSENIVSELSRRGVFPVGKLPPLGMEEY